MNKKFSQNFTVKQLLSFESRFSPLDFVVEIGCGTGNLSKRILTKNVKKLYSLEIDSRFNDELGIVAQKYPNFEYFIGDAKEKQEVLVEKIKKLNLETVPAIHITGNLPFNIAGELLSKWNEQSLLKTGLFSISDQVKMTLMFSEDMGKRFLPDFSKRTRFSTITQTAFDVEKVDVYEKACFNPQPAANVICLGFQARKNKLFTDEHDLNNYTTFLRKIYTLPNKQILRAISNGYKSDRITSEFISKSLESLDISPSERVFSTPIHKLLALSRLVELNTRIPV